MGHFISPRWKIDQSCEGNGFQRPPYPLWPPVANFRCIFFAAGCRCIVFQRWWQNLISLSRSPYLCKESYICSRAVFFIFTHVNPPPSQVHSLELKSVFMYFYGSMKESMLEDKNYVKCKPPVCRKNP